MGSCAGKSKTMIKKEKNSPEKENFNNEINPIKNS